MIFLIERVCPLCNALSLYDRNTYRANMPCDSCLEGQEEAKKDIFLYEQQKKSLERRLSDLEEWAYDHIKHPDPHGTAEIINHIIPEYLGIKEIKNELLEIEDDFG